MDFFEAKWSGSEIIASSLNVLAISYHSYWMNDCEKKKFNRYRLLYVFLSILLLVIYFILKEKEINKLIFNATYFSVTLFTVFFIPFIIKDRSNNQGYKPVS
jgi:ABC-type phosphate/phosphonate transport system permease subunit